MAVTILRSGKRVPAFVRGSLQWHRCRVCRALWDRPVRGGANLTRQGDVCPACRAALRETEAP